MSQSAIPVAHPVAVNGVPPGDDREMLARVQKLRLDDRLGGAKAARAGSAWLPWILCGVLALTWAGVAVRSYKNTSDAPADGPASAGPASAAGSPGPAIAPVAAGTVQLEVKGYLVPAQQIAVSPIEVGGRITELNIVEGKLFQKGDVLAKIDDTSYRTAAAEAEATLAAAEMRLAEIKPESVRDIEFDQIEGELAEAQAQKKRAEDALKRLRTIAISAAPRNSSSWRPS